MKLCFRYIGIHTHKVSRHDPFEAWVSLFGANSMCTHFSLKLLKMFLGMENPLHSLHQFHTPTICSMSKFLSIRLMKLELIPLSLNQYWDTYKECFHDNPPPCAFYHIAKSSTFPPEARISQNHNWRAHHFLPQNFSKPRLSNNSQLTIFCFVFFGAKLQ